MTSDETLPLVLFVSDFAIVLRCSVRTVERLHRAKQLPEQLPIPGRPRWARDVVLAWLSSGDVRRGRRR